MWNNYFAVMYRPLILLSLNFGETRIHQRYSCSNNRPGMWYIAPIASEAAGNLCLGTWGSLLGKSRNGWFCGNCEFGEVSKANTFFLFWGGKLGMESCVIGMFRGK